MTDKIILKFTKAHGVYVPGDVAGFEPVTAERFIAAKVAVKFNEKERTTGKTVGDPGLSPEMTAALADLKAREEAVAKREEALANVEADRASEKVGKKDGKIEDGAPPKTPTTK